MNPSAPITVLPQPDDTTCGPTCLHAVYRFWGDDIPLHEVVREIEPLPEGGTLAVNLANHALARGYEATLYTYNLRLFDPSWFGRNTDLISALQAQERFKSDHLESKLSRATNAYVEYLERGGTICYEELSDVLLARLFAKRQPILTGLSATYLYGCAREFNDQYDAISGEPTGHFVVLADYDQEAGSIQVADPLRDNPGFGEQYYRVSISRLIGAICLGIMTYDANLLMISKPEHET